MIEPWEAMGEWPGSAGYLPISTRRYRLPHGTDADHKALAARENEVAHPLR